MRNAVAGPLSVHRGAAPPVRPGGSIHHRLAASMLGLVVSTALAAGCAGKNDATDPTPAAGSRSAGASAMGMPMAMPSGPAYNDPSATPADKLAGADLKQAAFKLLDTRPPGSDSAAGTAWLAQNDSGTTVTITMTGLKPGKAYVAHLHAQQCAKDNGGAHFQFDPAGPTTPPNEVHLAFTADPDGKATVTVHNDRKVGDAAKAIVVHPMDAMDNRLACADF
jgi:Cu/Zn superoxide dismutase